MKTIYHPGQAFTCPQCGMSAVVLEEEIVEGLFEVVGKRFRCSVCGWQIPNDQVAVKPTDAGQSPASDDDALDALFGNHSPKPPELVLTGDTMRFCKNCRHYLQSPFQGRCLLHKRDVEPMGICDDFSTPSPDEK